MNETWTKQFKYVRERTSRKKILSFVVHERFLQFSFLPFMMKRTNEKTRFLSFMFIVRSCLDERMFVRPSCENFHPAVYIRAGVVHSTGYRLKFYRRTGKSWNHRHSPSSRICWSVGRLVGQLEIELYLLPQLHQTLDHHHHLWQEVIFPSTMIHKSVVLAGSLFHWEPSTSSYHQVELLLA